MWKASDRSSTHHHLPEICVLQDPGPRRGDGERGNLLFKCEMLFTPFLCVLLAAPLRLVTRPNRSEAFDQCVDITKIGACLQTGNLDRWGEVVGTWVFSKDTILDQKRCGDRTFEQGCARSTHTHHCGVDESVIFSVRGIHTRSHAFPAPIGGGFPSTGYVGRCWGVPRWGGSVRVVVSRPGEHGVAVRVVSKVQDPRGPKTLLVLHLQGRTMPWLCCCWHYQCHTHKTLFDALTDCQ